MDIPRVYHNLNMEYFTIMILTIHVMITMYYTCTISVLAVADQKVVRMKLIDE